MKKIFLFLLSIVSFSLAENFYCNNGSATVPGIPETSCVATTSSFFFGTNQDYNGSSNYYFVDFPDVTFTIGNEQNVPLRLIIHSYEPMFNAVQAITQTAFATNAKLSIIFKNPEYLPNFTTYGTNGMPLCRRFGDTGSAIVCYVDAITILR